MKFREGLLTGPPGTGTSAAVDLLLSKIEIFPSERRTPLFLLPVKASFKCLTVVNLEAAPKYTSNKVVDIMRRVKCKVYFSIFQCQPRQCAVLDWIQLISSASGKDNISTSTRYFVLDQLVDLPNLLIIIK